MADIVLPLAGGPKSGVFAVIDNKTGAQVSGATFANQAVGANSNPEFATFAIDPANPNNPVGTPIAPGSGTIIFTADANWSDPGDGSAQSITGGSVSKNFTVTPSPDGGRLDVIF